MDVARTGHALARSRMAGLARLATSDVRRGPGWVAVRTGAANNDLNGVVAEPGHRPDHATVAGLAAWFGGLPWSWLAAVESPEQTAALVSAGLEPEVGAWWAARPLPMVEHRVEVGVRRVESETDLQAWLEVATVSGWLDRREWPVHAALVRGVGWPRWVAGGSGAPLGMATGYAAGAAFELVDIAVVPDAQRQGWGTALAHAALDWGGRQGATIAVAAPSPDGIKLLHGLGFESFAAVPELRFYG